MLLDYTEWRKQQWLDETVASLAEKARALRKADNAHCKYPCTPPRRAIAGKPAPTGRFNHHGNKHE
jgi:hypothetical protein